MCMTCDRPAGDWWEDAYNSPRDNWYELRRAFVAKWPQQPPHLHFATYPDTSQDGQQTQTTLVDNMTTLCKLLTGITTVNTKPKLNKMKKKDESHRTREHEKKSSKYAPDIDDEQRAQNTSAPASTISADVNNLTTDNEMPCATSVMSQGLDDSNNMSTTVTSSTPLKTATNSTPMDRAPTDETCDKTTTCGNLPSDHPDESALTTNGYTKNASTESGVTLPTASDTPPHNVHTEHTLTEPENHDGSMNITTSAGRNRDVHVHSDWCAPQLSQQCQEHGPQHSTQGTDSDNAHSSQPQMTTMAATPDIQAAHTHHDAEPHEPETTQQHFQRDILCTTPVASCDATSMPNTTLHTLFPTTPRCCPRIFSAPPVPHRDARAEDLETGPTTSASRQGATDRVDERTSAGPSQPNDRCHHCGTCTPGSYATSWTTTTTPVPPRPTVTQATIQTRTLTDDEHTQTRTYNTDHHSGTCTLTPHYSPQDNADGTAHR
ncbi:hypothetical protein K439DRAFT_1616884 [Ramaria rubella]|nr:hypothetical protein K439DRAFT_1616884 [Ramaria rubella]